MIWGGNKDCEHKWALNEIKVEGGHSGGKLTSGIMTPQAAERRDSGTSGNIERGFCSLCGAWKGAYGLEPTPEMYIEHTIEILREIRRVLRKDGVVFWNIGDSYYTHSGGYYDNRNYQGESFGNQNSRVGFGDKPKHNILKSKDLCLIPFRVAIAAQEDGWWVRSVIIWSKPNPMPSSVTDRPSTSHEYILMLTKNASKKLYWTHRDGNGTREKPKADYRWVNQLSRDEVAIEPLDWKVKIPCPECNATGKVSVYLGLDVWQDKQCAMCSGKKVTQLWKRINLWKGHDYYWDADAVREPTDRNWANVGGNLMGQGIHKQGGNYKDIGDRTGREEVTGRNIRSVWEFPTQPYPEAHFAVFPEKLPEICIKAATPEVGCCSKCGAPWERIIEKGEKPPYKDTRAPGQHTPVGNGKVEGAKMQKWLDEHPLKTLGWKPTCSCNADKVPSLVLDPFGGAGTVAWVSKKLNRRCVMYELSEEYVKLSVDRCRQQVMM